MLGNFKLKAWQEHEVSNQMLNALSSLRWYLWEYCARQFLCNKTVEQSAVHRKYGTRQVAINIRGRDTARKGVQAAEVETRGRAEMSETSRRLTVWRAKILLTSSNTSMNSSGFSSFCSAAPSVWKNSFMTFPLRPCKDRLTDSDRH